MANRPFVFKAPHVEVNYNSTDYYLCRENEVTEANESYLQQFNMKLSTEDEDITMLGDNWRKLAKLLSNAEGAMRVGLSFDADATNLDSISIWQLFYNLYNAAAEAVTLTMKPKRAELGAANPQMSGKIEILEFEPFGGGEIGKSIFTDIPFRFNGEVTVTTS